MKVDEKHWPIHESDMIGPHCNRGGSNQPGPECRLGEATRSDGLRSLSNQNQPVQLLLATNCACLIFYRTTTTVGEYLNQSKRVERMGERRKLSIKSIPISL
jgi:hypothetical protein